MCLSARIPVAPQKITKLYRSAEIPGNVVRKPRAAAGTAGRESTKTVEWRSDAGEPAQPAHQQRKKPGGQRQYAQRRCDWPLKERDKLALGLDHRCHEILFQHPAEHDAENR